MSSNPQQQPKHHFRFYLILTTVVIGGIFILLLFNDSNSGFNLLTSSAVRTLGAGEAPEEAVDGSYLESPDAKAVFGKDLEQSSKEVEVKVTFDQIPRVKKDTRIEQLELKFDDLTTKISVNNDKLELNNLKEVTLTISGFEGKLDLDGGGISLGGTTRRLDVNGIAISSKGEIKIAFNDLDYRQLTIGQIELKELELPNGDGKLEVADKLTYSLEQDQLNMYFFNGAFGIKRETQTEVTLEGIAKGISVSGALLDLNVK